MIKPKSQYQTSNRFYSWSQRKQYLYFVVCVFTGLLILTSIILSLILLPFHGLILFWILYPFIFVVAQMIDTPTMVQRGKLVYFSTFFLVEHVEDKRLRIHAGTIFDYLFAFHWKHRGTAARKIVVQEFILGMKDFAMFLQNSEISPDTIIEGSSYFFSAKNAKKFGFDLEEAAPSTKFLLIINFLVVFLQYSFIQGRAAFPPIHKVKGAFATKAKLISKTLKE